VKGREYSNEEQDSTDGCICGAYDKGPAG
jgi:hypothetical protein